MIWNIQTLIISSIILLILDALYIFTTKELFFGMVQKIQHSPLKVDVYAAALTYIFILGGLNYFIVQKENKTPLEAFYLGILVYSVYELTTKSILRDWKWEAVVLDTIWGGVLFASTTYFTRIIVK